MKQNKIYMVATSRNEQDFYFIVNATASGLAIFVFDEEPSKQTEEEHALVIVHVDVETSSDDATRIMARLWDDVTEKEGDATHLLTLAEQ